MGSCVGSLTTQFALIWLGISVTLHRLVDVGQPGLFHVNWSVYRALELNCFKLEHLCLPIVWYLCQLCVLLVGSPESHSETISRHGENPTATIQGTSETIV